MTDQKSIIVLLGDFFLSFFLLQHWCSMRSLVNINSFPGSKSSGKKSSFPVKLQFIIE